MSYRSDPQEPALDPQPAGTWRVLGSSVAGTSHEKQGTPCQDAFAFRRFRLEAGETLVIAVADGAGSAEHSHRGAQTAVQTVAQHLETALTERQVSQRPAVESLVQAAYAAARQALLDLADEEELSLRSLSATLTCAVLAEGRLVTGQLGDGTVVAQQGEGPLRAITQPQRGEYANETYFITQEDALEHVQVLTDEGPFQAVAVLSDGLLRLALQLPAGSPHEPFFKPLLAFAASAADLQAAQEQLASFLRSERVNARTDDDKTLVLAVFEPLVGAAANGSGSARQSGERLEEQQAK